MYSARHYRSMSATALEMSDRIENNEFRDGYIELSIYWTKLANAASIADQRKRPFPRA